jgi:NADPH2:quinone reductase
MCGSEAVKRITNGRGVDVVFECVGGTVFDQSLRSLAWEGRAVVIGFLSGSIPQVGVCVTK